jgi:hypothetical protein
MGWRHGETRAEPSPPSPWPHRPRAAWRARPVALHAVEGSVAINRELRAAVGTPARPLRGSHREAAPPSTMSQHRGPAAESSVPSARPPPSAPHFLTPVRLRPRARGPARIDDVPKRAARSCAVLHHGRRPPEDAAKKGNFLGPGMVLPVWIEHTTSPLPRECSTTELRQRLAPLAGTAGNRRTGARVGSRPSIQPAQQASKHRPRSRCWTSIPASPRHPPCAACRRPVNLAPLQPGT